MRAAGEFDIQLTPVDTNPKRGHLRFTKQWRGDFSGTSDGEMFTTGTSVEGSGAYVAREEFSGELAGQRGTFCVQHLGTMAKGAFQLRIEIVPDSGTEQLVGITGAVTIKIEGGKHFYEIDYDLPR